MAPQDQVQIDCLHNNTLPELSVVMGSTGIYWDFTSSLQDEMVAAKLDLFHCLICNLKTDHVSDCLLVSMSLKVQMNDFCSFT